MVKKTRDLHYETHDAALGLHRCFLGLQADSTEICYDRPTKKEPEARAPKIAESAPVAEVLAKPTAVQDAIVSPQPLTDVRGTVVAEIPDREIPVSGILLPLVALKLKKGLNEIEKSKTIKQLVGGKSFLL
jgi:3-oxoacyl-ACP reductase-like protein